MIVKLKPCPFCGRIPKPMVREDSLDGFFAAVSCFNGGYTSHAYASAKDATYKENALGKVISVWNTRTDEEKVCSVDYDIRKNILEMEEEFKRIFR